MFLMCAKIVSLFSPCPSQNSQQEGEPMSHWRMARGCRGSRRGRWLSGMLKKARLLTRPTLARLVPSKVAASESLNAEL
jgi:hypothetical protein